jgi:tRNA pseudouridine65 synthase
MQKLPILYQDDNYIAIHKPPSLLVHRTRISQDKRFVLQMLRDQIDQWVYPIHRLDRPTSGVLIFGLNSNASRMLAQEFEKRDVKKRYLAVVRGYAEESGVIDYPLQEEEWTEPQPAVTTYRKLAQVELPYPVGRYQTARYSLLEVQPQTGRMHQIRKHMKHIFHPIVGDTTHGDGKHNQLFREQFDVSRLLLVATELGFQHPYTKKQLNIKSAPEPELRELFEKLGWACP